MSQWIPVTERLPENQVLDAWGIPSEVIVYSSDLEPNIALAWYEDGKWKHDEWGVLKGVTHWMPLPEPPSTVWILQVTEDGGA